MLISRKIYFPKVVVHLLKIGFDPQSFGEISNGLLVIALVQESESKVIMWSFLFRRFLHAIGPEFDLTIPNFVPPIGLSRKKKDHQTIDNDFFYVGFWSFYHALYHYGLRPLS